jgi:hypothetical protein
MIIILLLALTFLSIEVVGLQVWAGEVEAAAVAVVVVVIAELSL